MKKLVIVAAIALAAMASQAAKVSWTCTNVYAGNDSDKVGATLAYFLVTDQLSLSHAAALAGKGAAAVSSALSSYYSFTGAGAGAFGNSTGVDQGTLGLTQKTAYTAYLIIFDSDTITDSSKFYITSTKGFTTLDDASSSAASAAIGSQAAKGSKTSASWLSVKSSSSVPEPTSGLLVLLGVAGLALRRRRA